MRHVPALELPYDKDNLSRSHGYATLNKGGNRNVQAHSTLHSLRSRFTRHTRFRLFHQLGPYRRSTLSDRAQRHENQEQEGETPQCSSSLYTTLATLSLHSPHSLSVIPSIRPGQAANALIEQDEIEAKTKREEHSNVQSHHALCALRPLRPRYRRVQTLRQLSTGATRATPATQLNMYEQTKRETAMPVSSCYQHALHARSLPI